MKKWLKSSICLLLAIVMVVGNAAFVRAADESADPADDSRDIPLSALEVSCGDYETDGGDTEGGAELAVDNDTSTLWHTDWQGTSRANHWFQFKLTEEYAVDGLRYLPRSTGNSNGTITSYDIQVSDDGVTFRSVATGTWENNTNWKLAQFDPEEVQYVRLVSVDAVSDNSWVFASAAEIRLTGQTPEISNADKTALDALIADCEPIEKGNYTEKSWQNFQRALESARSVSANLYASQARVDEACETLSQARADLKEKVEGEGIQKILHLDSGRTLYSKDWTIALLNEMSAAGYTHLQLAFGNDGLRFVLDDMSVTVGDTTYASDDVKAGIHLGNRNYTSGFGYEEDKSALTEAEMDEIIAHGKSVGVEIIPHVNMPGHMDAILDAIEHVGIADAHFTGNTTSVRSLNLNNADAVDFTQALLTKYADYFAGKGCKYFHIGADEYANDAYGGSMGFPSMGSTLYDKFAQFVNQNAAIVKERGMTARAWNDGIRYTRYNAEFDTDIEITYWSSGWWGYDVATPAKFVEMGHGLINTNGDYYYILGVNDRFTPGTSTEHDPSLYTEAGTYDLNTFMGGTVEEPIGGMFCIWGDIPNAETEQEVGANIRLLLRAMALRMEGLSLNGMDTSVVAGGFNEDGTIADSGPDVTDPTDPDETDPTDPDETQPTQPTQPSEPDESEPTVPSDPTQPSEPEETKPQVPECEKDETCVLSQFSDIKIDDWYHDGVHFCVEEGIMNGMGDGTFAPNEATTRAQLVIMLYRLEGEPSIEGMSEPFTDVAETDWFYEPIVWAYNTEVVNGMTETTFEPNTNVSREQVATILYRYLGSPEGSGKLDAYPDVDKVQDYAKDALVWAVGEGLINGVKQADGTSLLDPAGNATRAQIATILMRYLTA